MSVWLSEGVEGWWLGQGWTQLSEEKKKTGTEEPLRLTQESLDCAQRILGPCHPEYSTDRNAHSRDGVTRLGPMPLSSLASPPTGQRPKLSPDQGLSGMIVRGRSGKRQLDCLIQVGGKEHLRDGQVFWEDGRGEDRQTLIWEDPRGNISLSSGGMRRGIGWKR